MVTAAATGTIYLDGEIMTFEALERRVGPTKAARVSALYCHRDWPGGRAEGLPRAAAIAVREEVSGWVAAGCVSLDAPGTPRTRSRARLNERERAELEVLRDLRQLVLGFGGDDYTIVPWVDRHRLHEGKGEPYIGCPFCREKFGLRSDVVLDVLAAMEEWGRAHGFAPRPLLAYLEERFGVKLPEAARG